MTKKQFRLFFRHGVNVHRCT